MWRQVRGSLDILGRQAAVRLGIIGVLVIVNMLLETVSVGLVIPFLGLLSDPAKASAIPYIGPFAGPDSRMFLLAACMIFPLVIAVKNSFGFLLAYLQAHFIWHQSAALSRQLFRRYLEASYRFHLGRDTPDLITVIDHAVDEYFSYFVMGCLSILTESVIIIGIGALLLCLEPAIFLVTGATLALLVLVFYRSLHARMSRLGQQDIDLRRSRLRYLQQALGSIKVVKVFSAGEHFQKVYGRVREEHAEVITWSTALMQLPRLLIETVVACGIVVAITILLLQDRLGSEAITVLALFATAAMRMMPSFSRLMQALQNIRYAVAPVKKVQQDIAALPQPESRPVPGAPTQPSIAEASIELRDVWYSYPNSEAPTLRGVTLFIAPGQSWGIVGPSGAGKSTLLDIMLGLLGPDSGQVLLGGRDLSADLGAWRRRIGYVPQDVCLVDGSFRQNIAFGVAEEAIDQAKVFSALKLARMDGFVSSLPDGLETSVGERGVRLSGGQKQRIGIARALYEDPPVLLLDEATSSLDSQTERDITQAIDGLKGRKTILIVAHRLTTVRQCDLIALLDRGRVSATGPFDALASSSAEFRNLMGLRGVVGETT